MKEAYDKLNKSISQFRVANNENDATISMLKHTVMDKQIPINNHIDTMAKLKQELETARIETERVDKKLISYSAAFYVLELILPKLMRVQVWRSGPSCIWRPKIG
ncbi:hypothetical protein Hanom_Chr17g01579231 [Helianthus anomalus]